MHVKPACMYITPCVAGMYPCPCGVRNARKWKGSDRILQFPASPNAGAPARGAASGKQKIAHIATAAAPLGGVAALGDRIRFGDSSPPVRHPSATRPPPVRRHAATQNQKKMLTARATPALCPRQCPVHPVGVAALDTRYCTAPGSARVVRTSGGRHSGRWGQTEVNAGRTGGRGVADGWRTISKLRANPKKTPGSWRGKQSYKEKTQHGGVHVPGTVHQRGRRCLFVIFSEPCMRLLAGRGTRGSCSVFCWRAVVRRRQGGGGQGCVRWSKRWRYDGGPVANEWRTGGGRVANYRRIVSGRPPRPPHPQSAKCSPLCRRPRAAGALWAPIPGTPYCIVFGSPLAQYVRRSVSAQCRGFDPPNICATERQRPLDATQICATERQVEGPDGDGCDGEGALKARAMIAPKNTPNPALLQNKQQTSASV
eukprot:gene18631-biopygen9966